MGDLDRVTRVVKLVGFVNCTDGFSGQPKVVNGASDLFAEVRKNLTTAVPQSCAERPPSDTQADLRQ